MDPTKQRARKFNTGKGAKGPAGPGGMDSSWTETPEQKRKRLADEVMGVAAPEKSVAERQVRSKEDKETERRMREKAVRLVDASRVVEVELTIQQEKARGKSLYEQHQKSTTREKDDDPSSRGFDYEKDMGNGMKIDNAKRKQMMNHAAGLGSKFSSGSYL